MVFAYAFAHTTRANRVEWWNVNLNCKPQNCGRLIFTIALAAMLANLGVATAHEDSRILEDRQPGWVQGGNGMTFAAGPAISFESQGMHLLSWLPLGSLSAGAVNGNDCWGYAAPSGREYAIIGTSNGTAFVEVTDPTDPVLVSFINGPGSLWRDMKVFGNRAYAVSEGGGGIQVFNMSLIDSGIVTVPNAVTAGGNNRTHNVFINEASGYLYRAGGGNEVLGARIYDLNASLDNPPFIAEWNDRYFHDLQVVTMTTGAFAGREICFGFSENQANGGDPGVDILDVTDKQNITLIDSFRYSTPVFSHQGFISPDEQYLYINDELDEINLGVNTTTRVVDISDLANPVEVGTFTTGLPAIDHNLYLKDNLIFQANYRSGIRIFDATNPIAPTEIAFFDTYPEDDLPEFNGLWSNYPFLPSGIIIGSDLEKGLFVWGLGEPQLSFEFPNGVPDRIASNGQTLTVEVVEAAGSNLSNDEINLHIDTGSGFVITPIQPTTPGGTTFDVSLPSGLECASRIEFFFSGKSQDGQTWRAPETAPVANFISIVADEIVDAFVDDFETDLGWTVGDAMDTATTGIWTRVDPNGTAAQPENDNTPDPGTMCFVTGQGGVGGSLGAADVDNGTTTLISPTFDGTGTNATISYYRWFSNNGGANPNQDVLLVDISNDNGDTWENLETVGPASPESSGGWFFAQVMIDDVVAPTATMRVRFVAEDADPGSIVEAAIDDFAVSSLQCAAPCPGATGDLDDNGFVNGLDVGLFVDAALNGASFDVTCAGDFSANGSLGAEDVADFVTLLLQ